MDNIKNIIVGSVITLVIGGTAYTFSQEDVINNFAEDTGLTQEQAEMYVNSVSEDELVSFVEVGSNYVEESKKTLAIMDEIDCLNYEYEWESVTLACDQAKTQLQQIANSERSLGNAFMRLQADSATEDDVHTAIRYLDQLNADYGLEVSVAIFDGPTMSEMKMTNSYNKSVLEAALENS